MYRAPEVSGFFRSSMTISSRSQKLVNGMISFRVERITPRRGKSVGQSPKSAFQDWEVGQDGEADITRPFSTKMQNPAAHEGSPAQA